MEDLKLYRKDGYVNVGPTCLPFDAEISLDEANELKNTVMNNVFSKMSVKTPTVNEKTDKTMCAKAFHGRYDIGTDDEPSIFAGIVISHIDAASWRMIIMRTKMGRAHWNNSQRRIEARLNIEVFNDRVAEAVRRVRVVRGVGELSVSSIEHQMQEDVEEGEIVMQRRAYERHITQTDCDQALLFLDGIVNRTAAS